MSGHYSTPDPLAGSIQFSELAKPNPGKWRGELFISRTYRLTFRPDVEYEPNWFRRFMLWALVGIRWTRVRKHGG
jgi:hypothetical protein